MAVVAEEQAAGFPGIIAMLGCYRLRHGQQTGIQSGALRMNDALWLPCECCDCWALFDAEEYDRQEEC